MTPERHEVVREVSGPWSLATSKRFWEGFAPTALEPDDTSSALRTAFVCEADWSTVEAVVTQEGSRARIRVAGAGDLEGAVDQVLRLLSLDVDAQGWPGVARRDPVVAHAQAALPGLRPCGFHSPYEAAAWAVLSQRIRITQAARLRSDLVRMHGVAGAFPSPQRLMELDLDLPGRKTEYLRAVAHAADEGRLDATALRSCSPDEAMRRVQEIKGLGPFAAELVVIRGANAPDVLPRHEARLEAEVRHRYGPERDLEEVAQAWRPFRSWAAVHLRVLREQRTHEITGAGGQRGTGSSSRSRPT